ncbi:hypothetical protein SLEP1_g55413 [Rubroshorea leprosula]|uniref:Uncharacterized protein n=1 Tax=Rubroshorea leprosula TaxID=152421 RepID=A0AAV5MFG2_9ROSI|nr:hypothetical protein SLEP1_g55413 [Rubroshorea leprosula]
MPWFSDLVPWVGSLSLYLQIWVWYPRVLFGFSSFLASTMIVAAMEANANANARPISMPFNDRNELLVQLCFASTINTNFSWVITS